MSLSVSSWDARVPTCAVVQPRRMERGRRADVVAAVRRVPSARRFPWDAMRSTCVDVSVGNICAARAVAVGTGDVMVSFTSSVY